MSTRTTRTCCARTWRLLRRSWRSRTASATCSDPQPGRCSSDLVGKQVLRRRPTGWYWARPDRAAEHVSLRGTGEVVRVVEARTGRVLGLVDEPRSHAAVHPGAVYVHQGETCVVTDLDLERGRGCRRRGDPGWSTHARSVSSFDLVATEALQRWGPATLSLGRVVVHTQVTCFLRRLPGGQVVGEHPLDLPERTMPTKAIWWTIPEPVLRGVGLGPLRIPGALHAAEHASIGLLPLVATSDRWDIGGVSTVLHPDTGLPTVLVYDGVLVGPASPGGGMPQPHRGCARRWRRSAVARASTGVRRASSRPNAATATSPSTRPARSASWTCCLTRRRRRNRDPILAAAPLGA